MYINEVLRRCDILCPNEYGDCEKYMWCDDLSAMLTQEHIRKYEKVRVKCGPDGTYLLPEGVTYEMIDMIISGNREIKKYDFRSYGIRYLYGMRGQLIVPERCRCGKCIDVIYIKKHEPIRDTLIAGDVSFAEDFTQGHIAFTADGFYFDYTCEDGGGLLQGDSVDIEIYDGEELVASMYSVPVLSNKFSGKKGVMEASVPPGTFGGWVKDKSLKGLQCEIRRVVTDETVCDAPYDVMYVDYVNAQICYYQRDFNTYNRHMNLFNQRLAAYQTWLQKRRTMEKDNQIKNWM